MATLRVRPNVKAIEIHTNEFSFLVHAAETDGRNPPFSREKGPRNGFRGAPPFRGYVNTAGLQCEWNGHGNVWTHRRSPLRNLELGKVGLAVSVTFVVDLVTLGVMFGRIRIIRMASLVVFFFLFMR